MRSDPTPEISLGDIVDLQRGTTYKSALLDQPGPALLGLASIQRNGGFRGDALRTYGGDSPEKLLVRPGELYVSLKDVTQSGDLLGAVARVPKGVTLGRLTQDTVKLVFRSNELPRDYIYWLLRTPQYRAYCRSHAIGVTTLALPREDFLSFCIPTGTSNRLRVLDALVAIDDKIEHNKTRASREAAILNTGFLSTFSALTRPDEEVPFAWHLGVLGDEIEVVMGQSPPGSTYTDDHSVGLPLIQGNADLGERYPEPTRNTTAPTKRSRVGDLIFTVRAPVGELNLSDAEYCLGRGVAALRSDLPVYTEQLIRALATRWSAEETGTIFPSVNREQILGLRIARPPRTAAEEFDLTFRPLYDSIAELHRETRTLALVRDALLPSLISGRIQVG